MILEFFLFKKSVGKSNMRSLFRSLVDQVVISPTLACHVLSKDNFVNVFMLVRKTFCFCKFCDIYVEKENKKSESTRTHYENAKSHLGESISPPNIFALNVNF